MSVTGYPRAKFFLRELGNLGSLGLRPYKCGGMLTPEINNFARFALYDLGVAIHGNARLQHSVA